MVGNNRQSALLMEILIAVLFFALSATVILEMFVAASSQSTRAAHQSEALYAAQNLADRLYAAENDEALLASEGFSQKNKDWTLSCDGYTLWVTISRETGEAGELHLAQVSAYAPQGDTEVLLFSLPCARYTPGEVTP